jgi:hypothetical protein
LDEIFAAEKLFCRHGKKGVTPRHTLVAVTGVYGPASSYFHKCVMEIVASDIKELFHSFTEEEWHDLNKRLSYFFFVHYGREPRLVREDLIQGAILDAYEGRRHWPVDLKLVTFLCGVMRSNASHILEKENNHPLQSIEEISNMALLQKEDIYTHMQLCDEIRDLVSDDPILSRMAEYIMQDPGLRPRDIVALMPDISKKEIYNANRRLNKSIHNLNRNRNNG